MASLADQSLLWPEAGPDGEPRYRMLETVREFGLDQLAASGEEATTRNRHAAWCLALAERAQAATWGGPEHSRWLDRLETEIANLRGALAWLEETGDAATGLALAAALSGLWHFRSHRAEGRARLAHPLARSGKIPTHVRAKALVERVLTYPRGHNGRLEFENACLDALRYLLVPPLSAPIRQPSTRSGTARRDVAFPNRVIDGSGPWGRFYFEFDANLILVDFENYDKTDIGAGEVNQLRNYMTRATGKVGLIVCSKEPVESAHIARNTAWSSSDEMRALLTLTFGPLGGDAARLDVECWGGIDLACLRGLDAIAGYPWMPDGSPIMPYDDERSRGSSASRSPSPRRLKPRTVRPIAAPGRIEAQGASRSEP